MTFVAKSVYFVMSEVKKKAGTHCCAFGCSNKPCKRKRGLCHKHYHRYRKIIDPVYNRFCDFRKNALSRSKDFTITLDEFRQWCIDNRYLEKGRRGHKCTIDRIKNEFGYHIWNIQILDLKANIAKYHTTDKHFTELESDNENYIPF